MLRRIVGYGLLTIAFADICFVTFVNVQNSMRCTWFMQNYVQYPPVDIQDYTSRDFAFDEWCNPTYSVVGYGADVVLLVLGVTMLRKKKKKPVQQ